MNKADIFLTALLKCDLDKKIPTIEKWAFVNLCSRWESDKIYKNLYKFLKSKRNLTLKHLKKRPGYRYLAPVIHYFFSKLHEKKSTKIWNRDSDKLILKLKTLENEIHQRISKKFPEIKNLKLNFCKGSEWNRYVFVYYDLTFLKDTEFWERKEQVDESFFNFFGFKKTRKTRDLCNIFGCRAYGWSGFWLHQCDFHLLNWLFLDQEKGRHW